MRRSDRENGRLGGFLLGGAALLAAVVAASILASSQQAPSSDSDPAIDRTPSENALDREAGRAVAAAFGVLNTSPEPLPASLRRVMVEPPPGARWNLAQQVHRAPESNYWLMAGQDALCLVEDSATGEIRLSCAPNQVALKEGVWSVLITPVGGPRGWTIHQRRMLAVVPDWVERVQVRTGGQLTEGKASNGIARLVDDHDQPPDEVVLLPPASLRQ